MYVPFLKAKQNELLALRTCSDEAFDSTIPFFDIPRPKDNSEEEIKLSISKSKGYIEKLCSSRDDVWFYLDCFDIPPEITIDGGHIYEYILNEFSELDILPVIGLDREEEHVDAVASRGHIFEDIAIRLLVDDIQIPNMTISEIRDLISKFDEKCTFDLVFDLRLIRELPTNSAANIAKIINTFATGKKISNFIVTGSIIPPVITDICKPDHSHTLIKTEARLFQQVSSLVTNDYLERLWYGDYASVSPDYSDSDIAPQLMRTVQTPRIIYSHKDKLYITRGGSLQQKGDDQYFGLAQLVVANSLWRGKDFSDAEMYIYDVSERKTPKCGNASKWINITICAHIEFYARFDMTGKDSRLKSA